MKSSYITWFANTGLIANIGLIASESMTIV